MKGSVQDMFGGFELFWRVCKMWGQQCVSSIVICIYIHIVYLHLCMNMDNEESSLMQI